MAHVKDEVLYGAEIKKRVREMADGGTLLPPRVRCDHVIGVSGTKEMGVLVKDIRVGDVMVIDRQARVVIQVQPNDDEGCVLLKLKKLSSSPAKAVIKKVWPEGLRKLIRRPVENV
ncbi:TPA: hypothetical protein ACHG3F_003115 [Escherichia coli]